MLVPLPKELKVFMGLGEKLEMGEANAANGEVATLVVAGVWLKMLVGGGGVVSFAAKMLVEAGAGAKDGAGAGAKDGVGAGAKDGVGAGAKDGAGVGVVGGAEAGVLLNTKAVEGAAGVGTGTAGVGTGTGGVA
ncbi:hypothetical protein PBCVCVR1_717L [Paramecium bursaria Chlorella virus CVR-1]|uniref:Uncharacterized protein n=1 Tax=Paramecium bursaria Chlorella virus CVA-1 TaxID=42683 RepID=M1GYA7_9PHYC|nr:hypothetical protein F8205_gp232 [Paramecium bursaria Chlorella virus CVA-1]AGE50593.1 hypothetical protein PBCVCVA1_710L [Paramecium bursaria Chlorella virus CVA-1]AGE52272.1 hypothetical protein PBCVCVR1_717L [Paramecium bursaria Chlorella virus CVR-1]